MRVRRFGFTQTWMVQTMSDVVLASVVYLATYRAAREAKRLRAVPTQYQLWYPGAGELGPDTIVLPTSYASYASTPKPPR